MKGKAIKTLCAIALTTGLFTVLPAGAEAFSLGPIFRRCRKGTGYCSSVQSTRR